MWSVWFFLLIVCPLSVYLGIRMLRRRREEMTMQQFRFPEAPHELDSKAVFEALSKVKLEPLGRSEDSSSMSTETSGSQGMRSSQR